MKLTKIALGVALAAGTVAAQAADNLWFPHVVVSGTVTTIASVINTNGAAAEQHWMYVGKNLMPADDLAAFNGAACSEVDLMLPTSNLNIQTVDLGGVISKAGDYGVLFNDPSVKNNWRAVMGIKSYALARAYMAGNALATRGYLVVNDATAAAGSLEGYALVFDYKTGSAWGYKAETLDNATLANHAHAAFGAHVMPRAESISRLLITPVLVADYEALVPGAASFTPNMDVTVAPQVVGGSGHIVDRDENPISGAATGAVTCVGTVDLTDLVSPGAAQFTPDGGWMSVLSAAGTVPGTGAVIYQLDFGGQGATQSTLNGVSYPGTWNNVFQVQ